jgi:hypothetical protein
MLAWMVNEKAMKVISNGMHKPMNIATPRSGITKAAGWKIE